MNVVDFIGALRQLFGWARCDGQGRHKEIDRMVGELYW